MKSLLLTIGAGLALSGPLPAALHIYNIDGWITSAPNVPNIIPGGPQWSFNTIPATFSGSFIADCDHAGPVSSLTLEIGGVDVVATHPDVVLNIFDPVANNLFWAGRSAEILLPGDILIDPSFVSLGNTTNTTGVPFDRVVAVQNVRAEDRPPGDPVFIRSQNFEGSFDVTKGARVPDAGPTVIGTSAGFGILLLINSLRGRKERSKA